MPAAFLRSKDLQALSGLSRASIARLAREGDIPGARRKDGVHFEFPDSPELRNWAKARKIARNAHPLQPQRKTTRPSSVRSLTRQYERWSRRVSLTFPDSLAWDRARQEFFHDILCAAAQDATRLAQLFKPSPDDAKTARALALRTRHKARRV